MCPICKGKLTISKLRIFCENSHGNFTFEDGIPCFIDKILTKPQKSELGWCLPRRNSIRAKKNYFNVDQNCYKWALNWINNQTVNRDTKILCIGGAFLDDIPHVKSNYKFNIDHLSYKYIEIFPEMIQANVKYISSKSELLPFKDNFIDIIYSRNSMDHFENRIKTLVELNRVLKPEGKLFISVYYYSNFINAHETTSIDKDFVENHLKNLFEVEYIQISPSEVEGVPQGPLFSLPNNKKLSWLYVVSKKKEIYEDYDAQILNNYAKLTSDFQTAIYYQKRKEYSKAVEFFEKVSNQKAFLESDKNRILYSRIQCLTISNKNELIKFFNEFKISNNDIFWWKIVINAFLGYLDKEIKNAIKRYLPVKTQKYLMRYIKIKKFKWLNMNGVYLTYLITYLDHLILKLPPLIQSIYKSLGKFKNIISD